MHDVFVQQQMITPMVICYSNTDLFTVCKYCQLYVRLRFIFVFFLLRHLTFFVRQKRVITGYKKVI